MCHRSSLREKEFIMNQTSNTGGLDRFRIWGALLVVAIHTSPLTCLSAEADFLLTRIAARVAVPFFLMVTGQFVLPRILEPGPRAAHRLLRYLTRTGLLYLACILLYLPLGIYAGHYKELDLAKILRMLFWDGTFYHLWYFPACMMGMLLLFLLSRRLRPQSLAAVCVLLYLLGLSGDSYYGLTAYLPPLRGLCDWGFHIWSYTRNGLFLSPLFLLMGAHLGQLSWKTPDSREHVETGRFIANHLPSSPALAVGLAFSLLLLTGEAFGLRGLEAQRHDSMYLMLIPVMYCLYGLLLRWPCPPSPKLRRIAMLVYILHPAFIVAVRLCARLPYMLPLKEHSLIHYLAVCACSLAAAWLLTIPAHWRGAKPARSRNHEEG